MVYGPHRHPLLDAGGLKEVGASSKHTNVHPVIGAVSLQLDACARSTNAHGICNVSEASTALRPGCRAAAQWLRCHGFTGNVCLQALSAEGAVRIAMDAAGASSAAQQTALAAFEYGLHAQPPVAAQAGGPHATFGTAENNDDMEQ